MPDNLATSHEKPADPPDDLAVERLWEPNETAAYLHISRSKLYALISRGEAPPAYRVGSALRFDPIEVRTWLGGRAVTGAVGAAA